jgi:hypothetical protein
MLPRWFRTKELPKSSTKTNLIRRPQLAPDEDGSIWPQDERFANALAQNTTHEQIVLSRAGQRPISVNNFQEPVPRPAWKSKPPCFLIGEEDQMINPKTQHSMAEGMNATVRAFAIDHTPLLIAPDRVVDVILEAFESNIFLRRM